MWPLFFMAHTSALLSFVFHQASHSLLFWVKGMVVLCMQEAGNTNLLEPCLMHLFLALISEPDYTWWIPYRYFKILYFYQSRSYTLAKVNITFALLHRTNLHRNSGMISENSFIEGFNSTSSSKSMTASRMYASLSHFSLKRRHSSWAEHQITKSCAWHKTHKKDFNYLWMQVCYSSKSIPEYQFRPLAPRSWSPAV